MKASGTMSSQTGRFSHCTNPFDPSSEVTKQTSKTYMKLFSFNASQRQGEMTFGENVGKMTDSRCIQEDIRYSGMNEVITKKDVTRSTIIPNHRMRMSENSEGKGTIIQSQMIFRQQNLPQNTASKQQQAGNISINPKMVIQEEESDQQIKQSGCFCFQK